jgi:hypothetical protein
MPATALPLSLATDTALPVTLVWIDSRDAIVLRWHGGSAAVERFESEVPPHRRATGRIRHEPGGRGGGSTAYHDSDEPHRLEHLDQFVARVAAAVVSDEELVVIGPGYVREHLEAEVRRLDERHHRERPIRVHPARRLTERQLVAHLRHLVGDDPARATVGAYRWTGAKQAGMAVPRPRRVLQKPPRAEDLELDEPDDEAPVR